MGDRGEGSRVAHAGPFAERRAGLSSLVEGVVKLYCPWPDKRGGNRGEQGECRRDLGQAVQPVRHDPDATDTEGKDVRICKRCGRRSVWVPVNGNGA